MALGVLLLLKVAAAAGAAADAITGAGVTSGVTGAETVVVVSTEGSVLARREETERGLKVLGTVGATWKAEVVLAKREKRDNVEVKRILFF
jgi:hypothetical protein